MDLTDLLPRSDEEKFLGLRYPERLEKLKPIIIQLYMESHGPGGKGMTARQIADFMRDGYALNLGEKQLQYHLRNWNVRKHIRKNAKDDVTTALGRRARAGASTSDVILQKSKPLDKKKLRRHLQDKIHRYVVEPMAPGVLSAWDLPYAALIRSIVRQPEKYSPYGDKPATPIYMTINSPNDATNGLPTDNPSPSMQLIQQKWIQDQSNLFLQGQFHDLFKNCNREARIALTNYFHDFWVHTYITAKYWGRGPLLWTKDMVSTMTLTSLAASNSIAASPVDCPSSSTSRDQCLLQPKQCCSWVIHYEWFSEDEWDSDDSEDYQPPNDLNKDSWKRWPSQVQSDLSLTHSMQESLTKSDFTSFSPGNLPISSASINESISKDQRSLHLESLKFAIMAGNHKLMLSILKQGADDHFATIHPYHLAATYLDGGDNCCMTLIILIDYLKKQYPIARNNENSMGHTVFDCLIISVLRSHTNVLPEVVSSGFADMETYPGEEKDACGRWDAGSPIIRQLFQKGSHRIPLSWKHPFCHSSIQAVCHSLMAIFYPGNDNPHFRHSSGLFIRNCKNCDAKLTLGPLHLVVVLAYHLAASDIQGETLFGAVAVLTCLLRLGAGVLSKTEVSIYDILGDSCAGVCLHEYMDADEFIQTVPSEAIDLWRPECQIGWDCMRGILRLAKAGKIHHVNKSNSGNQLIATYIDEPMSMDIDDGEIWDGEKTFKDGGNGEGILPESSKCPLKEYHDLGFPCGNTKLGLVWVVIQAEMLTYRRIQDVHPWISENFSMAALKEWLEGEIEELQMPLVEEDMLWETTPCGWIDNKNFPFSTEFCLVSEDISNYGELFDQGAIISIYDTGKALKETPES